MMNIEVIDNLEEKFYQLLETNAEEYILDNHMHGYLSRLLALRAESPEVWASPSWKAKTRKQVRSDVAMAVLNNPFNNEVQCDRLSEIGDDVLFRVGFMPESFIHDRKQRWLPEPDHIIAYALEGVLAYAMASDVGNLNSKSQDKARMMWGIANCFGLYAGALYQVRMNFPGLPIHDVDLFMDMMALIRNSDKINPETAQEMVKKEELN